MTAAQLAYSDYVPIPCPKPKPKLRLVVSNPGKGSRRGKKRSSYGEGCIVISRARYYDPRAGRFITKDPIGFAAGVNLYVYVKNNPIRFRDPAGLDSYDPIMPSPAYQTCIQNINAYFSPLMDKAIGDYNACLEKCTKDQKQIRCMFPNFPTNDAISIAACKLSCYVQFLLIVAQRDALYLGLLSGCYNLYQYGDKQKDYWHTHDPGKLPNIY